MKRDAYSWGDDPSAKTGESIQHYPRFDLSYSFDDQRRPREVTVYEHGENIATSWITVDTDTAIPMERIR